MLLHPLDLLHLARIHRTIRDILMTRRSRYIWSHSFRELEDGPPEPPPFLCEPQYAAFLFESVCSNKASSHDVFLSSIEAGF